MIPFLRALFRHSSEECQLASEMSINFRQTRQIKRWSQRDNRGTNLSAAKSEDLIVLNVGCLYYSSGTLVAYRKSIPTRL